MCLIDLILRKEEFSSVTVYGWRKADRARDFDALARILSVESKKGSMVGGVHTLAGEGTGDFL